MDSWQAGEEALLFYVVFYLFVNVWNSQLIYLDRQADKRKIFVL